jgi:aspartyl-tRNA(Asn)/glutamyl-tRNA(Gln) amidotransferase subunit A
MHKPESQEAVTSLHDLSAVDLMAGFRAKQFSPSEVLEDVLAHIARNRKGIDRTLAQG